jgi:hypothetical protein
MSRTCINSSACYSVNVVQCAYLWDASVCSRDNQGETYCFRPEQTIRLVAVTLVVISTLFVITAGSSSEQLAPAMGLFGTIAGYRLGTASGKSIEIPQ